MSHSRRSQDDFDEEIKAHLALEADELRREGLSNDEAHRRARTEFGNVQGARERFYLKNRIEGLDNLIRDLKFAARQLRKHPAFSLTAILTLALGIGANTAIFAVVQSVLLAPLPYANPQRLALLETRWSNNGKITTRVTGPDAVDLRAQSKSLQAVSLYSGGQIGVTLGDHSTYTQVTWTDENFAKVFTLQPVAGRLFTDAESHHAALISESFARDNFGSSQAALGHVMHIESEAIEIVGVLPDTFHYPGKTQIWQAFPLQPESKSRTAFNYRAVALLRPDANFKSAQAELESVSARLQAAYPSENRDKQLTATPLSEALTGSVRPTLLLLWATVAIILLIACVNVTHLQLVRSMERQREIAIRKALGSNRWQVIQPVLLESLLLALLGAAAGILLALPTMRLLVAMAPKELPRANEIHLNSWVLAFTALISIATAMAAAIFPAVRAAKVQAGEALKHDASRGITRKGSAALRDGLVIAEVAASFVLAMAAGLLLRTMTELMTRDLGFDTRQMLIVDADAPAHEDADYQRVIQQFNQLFADLGSLPGVERAAGVMGLPMGPYGSNGYYSTRGGLPVDPQHKPSAVFSVASPGYFQTMGIPIKRGRDFAAEDTYQSPFVVVISEAAARQSFGTADPIGRQIQCGLDSNKWMTIIGVVGDIRQDSPAELPGPALYMPMTQHPGYANQIHIVLRTHVQPLTLLNTVQAKITATNPLIATRFTTMDAIVSDSITVQRFRAALISAFAGTGLLLAMLGVYGTTAYSVTQRTFEIGVRMAFGANWSMILRGILERAAMLAACGILLGLGSCFLLARLVASMLVGVRPMDPVSAAGAALVLLLTALAAASAPGWRATRIHPLQALRAE